MCNLTQILPLRRILGERLGLYNYFVVQRICCTLGFRESERWRPLYEALRAVQAGSAQYLRRVAPEVRSIAEAILVELAPELAEGSSARDK
jgi:hypothetical protein